MYQAPIPARVRLLILGGGIHGVGVLHDMVSRGWKDVHLLEKGLLGNATSARSTKLIHGGLRYLRNLRDFPLVAEALRERKVLMMLAPDLVKPLELFLPLPKQGGVPAPILRAGLMMYDLLAGRAKLQPYSVVTPEDALRRVPILDVAATRKIFSFWDAQTDDLGLVRRVAASAVRHGAGVTEGCRATAIAPTEDGWNVDVVTGGERQTVSALYVMNATGPWANQLLESSQMKPVYHGVNSEGTHLLFPDAGMTAGMFLQDPLDHRIFFVLPWQGHTLVGTTETLYGGDPDVLRVRSESVEYLLKCCRQYLAVNWTERDIKAQFTGLRWLAADENRELSRTSRAYVIGEHKSGRGSLMTLYGGKLTTYRNLAKTIGDRICQHYGEAVRSRTHLPELWLSPEEALDLVAKEARPIDRFLPGGIAYTPPE